MWKSLGADIRIGIASIGDETAFSFIYKKDCEGIVSYLPAKVGEINGKGCKWNSNISLEDIEKL